MLDAPCTGFRHETKAGHAPCTGSRDGVEARTGTFMVGGDRGTSRTETASFWLRAISPLMVGGDPGVFEGGKPYFERVGKQFRRCDGPGFGAARQVDQQPDSFQYHAGIHRGTLLEHKGRFRSGSGAGYSQQQRCPEPINRIQSPLFSMGFANQPFSCVDGKDTGLALDAEKNRKSHYP